MNERYKATQAQSSQPISFPVVLGHDVDIGCFATETNNKDINGLLIDHTIGTMSRTSEKKECLQVLVVSKSTLRTDLEDLFS